MIIHRLPFHEDDVLSVKLPTGEVFVPLKGICSNIGLDWGGQSAKIRHPKWKRKILLLKAKDNSLQRTNCIPLNKLNAWLLSINSLKIRSDLRPKLEQYQNECFDALNVYWKNPKQIIININQSK